MYTFARTVIICLLVLCIVSCAYSSDNNFRYVPSHNLIRYNMAELLSLRSSPFVVKPSDLPKEIRPRKRGRKGGFKSRNKSRGFKPFLPTVITGNVRSLANKTDELSAWIQHNNSFKTCSLICFSETWLDSDKTDECVVMDGFKLFRGDRDYKETQKTKGGGVCVYVNKNWCNPQNCTLKYQHCDKNIEFISVGIRPYYLPREFTQVIVTSLYIPPDANYTHATERLGSHIGKTHNLYFECVAVVKSAKYIPVSYRTWCNF